MLNTFLFVLFLIIGGSAAYAGFSAAPWLPTRKRERTMLLEKLTLTDDQIIYDLGCGTGSMLFAVADKYPNTRAIGYEISVLPCLIGNLKKIAGGEKYKNVSIKFGNLFTQDMSKADVIFVYLLTKSYPKLIKKFKKELKDNCKVIVEAWPMQKIEHQNKIEAEDCLPIYIYKGEQFRNV